MARLTSKDRKIISQMYNAEESNLKIAIKVGVHPCTIYEELKRGYTGELDKNGRNAYDPDLAQHVLHENLRRCGIKKRKPGRRI